MTNNLAHRDDDSTCIVLNHLEQAENRISIWFLRHLK